MMTMKQILMIVTLFQMTMSETDEFEFGEPWHTKNLPSFPLIEGETYLVPLKLLSKERRFDGGRGTEFYLFGDCERLGRYVSFSDYNLPQGIEQVLNNEEPLTSHEEIFEDLKKIGKCTTFC